MYRSNQEKFENFPYFKKPYALSLITVLFLLYNRGDYFHNMTLYRNKI